MDKKLIVLDLNGLLIERLHKSEFKKKNLSVFADFVTSKNILVFYRPYAKEFLKYVFRAYDVGVWSSMTKKNTFDILENLLTREQRASLKLVLTQENCRHDGEYIGNKPIFYKEFDKLCTLKNLRVYKKNIIIIDDSAYKCRYNPPNTSIHPTRFVLSDNFGDGVDIELLRLENYLKYLETASLASSFIEQYTYESFTSNTSLSSITISDVTHAPSTTAQEGSKRIDRRKPASANKRFFFDKVYKCLLFPIHKLF